MAVLREKRGSLLWKSVLNVNKHWEFFDRTAVAICRQTFKIATGTSPFSAWDNLEIARLTIDDVDVPGELDLQQ